jgi:hypothetical protein
MKLALPLEPEVTQVLEEWEAKHRADAKRVLIGFGKLHLAINAQNPGPGLEALKAALTVWEDEMLDWFLSLENIVGILRDGYGGSVTTAKYRTAIRAIVEHLNNYRTLRSLLMAFLDGETDAPRHSELA